MPSIQNSESEDKQGVSFYALYSSTMQKYILQNKLKISVLTPYCNIIWRWFHDASCQESLSKSYIMGSHSIMAVYN